MSEQSEASTAREQHSGAVPKTVPELYWRLVFFAAGVVFAGVAL